MTTRPITINGYQFQVSTPYAEGHTLSEIEAHTLNQVRGENIRNNISKQIKTILGDEKELTQAQYADFQQKVAAYDAEYTFNMASARVSRDPVETEARRLTRAYITRQIKESGARVMDYSKETIEDLIEKNWANEEILALAQKNVAQANEKPQIALKLKLPKNEG